MPFLLDEIVKAAREANTFDQVNYLELALDGAYTERRIFEFMSLFNPAALVKLRVVNTLPELYSILTALHFKLKSLDIEGASNFSALQKSNIGIGRESGHSEDSSQGASKQCHIRDPASRTNSVP